MLRLELFGEPRVLRHGQAISRFESKRALALLAYLALFPETRHTRESLVDRIWPDAPFDSGRNRLKQALASIRRIVEPPGVSPGSVIDSDRTYVGIRPGSLVCDIEELRTAINSGEFSKARDLLRGEFMPGFFDDWLEDIRYEIAAYEVDLEDETDFDQAPDAESERIVQFRTEIPAAVSSFVSREKETVAVNQALEANRLVTVTGFGGLGKTRITQHVGLSWGKGDAWFVPLASVATQTEIVPAILKSLGAETQSNNDPFESLRLALSKEQCLLILDNLEQVASPETNRIITKILEMNPQVRLLCSSRIPLKIEGEAEIHLWPLETPEENGSIEALSQNPSLRLFIDRARQSRPDFQLTANNQASLLQICKLLGGIPLAIELCAAWSHFGVGRMLEMLQEGHEAFESRRKSSHDRHASLGKVLESTIELLSVESRELIGKLSIFRGDWPWNLATKVFLPPPKMEALSELIEASLVRPKYETEPPRFELLESIRQFAGGLIAEEILFEHQLVFARQMAKFAVNSRAIQPEPSLGIESQGDWVAFLEENWQNFRQAAIILQEANLADELVDFVWNTEWFWSIYGGEIDLPRLLVPCQPETDLARQKRELLVATHLTAKQTDDEISEQFNQILLESEERGFTDLAAESHLRRAKIRLLRQDMEHVLADAEAARKCFEQAKDSLGLGQALHIICNSHIQMGDPEKVHSYMESATRQFELCRNQINLAAVSYSRARHHYMNKRFEEALVGLYECRDLGRELRNYKYMGRTANFMGVVLRNLDQEVPARVYFYLSLVANARAREIRGSHMPLWNLYLSLGMAERWEQAVPIMACSMNIWNDYFKTPHDEESDTLLTEFVSKAKTALGPHKFIALEAQGKTWTLEAAQAKVASCLSLELKTHEEEAIEFFGPRPKS